ncbi:MAG: hypothetical protein AAFP20_16340 [Cyanobacteria bacterium J06614_10]
MSDKAIAAMGLLQADRKAVWACGGWALLSVCCFFVSLFIGGNADWFPTLVSLLKMGSFLIAAALCWRNAVNPDILSGRGVWQAIAVGLVAYALGDTTVILWRSLWGVSAAVALADVFYAVSYLFLAIGLFQAVLPRRITLNLPQTLGISMAGVLGIVLASWIAFQAPSSASLAGEVAAEGGATTGSVFSVEAIRVESKGVAAGAVVNAERRVPPLVATIEQRLSPLTTHIGLLYVVGDCVLVVIAVALLVAFWGGTYSEAWKLVALAGLCLYVADMFLIYEVGQGSYRQGAFWEIFWILSALFFGLSAAVEHGVSDRIKRQVPRRSWL